MIRDITIGQYYPAKSPIHRLDPRVKLLGTLIFVISLFIEKNVLIYGIATVVLIVLIDLSRVPFSYMLKGLKPIMFLLLFTCAMNLFFVRGEHLIWHWHFISIYTESVSRALFLGVRLTELILGSALMTYTTTPTELTDGLEKAFSPLTKLHLPVHEVALMMSIALRFIPILTEELDRIMKAQSARCVDFDEGGIIKRIKKMSTLLMPLFSSALKRAGDLALAMEARCYQAGQTRAKMHPLRYRKSDMAAYCLMFVYLAAIICIKYIY